MKGERGFTLVELAIVLVIIGIILGAVMKGQDLITNARAKKLISDTKKWEVYLFSYLDQKGKFPGDTNNDGLIDGDAYSDVENVDYVSPPSYQLRLGGSSFYFRVGTVSYNSKDYNAIFLCASPQCDENFDKQQSRYLEYLDTSIDGELNATGGLTRGVDSTGGSITASSSADNTTANATVTSFASNWDNVTFAVYFFDRKPD